MALPLIAIGAALVAGSMIANKSAQDNIKEPKYTGILNQPDLIDKDLETTLGEQRTRALNPDSRDSVLTTGLERDARDAGSDVFRTISQRAKALGGDSSKIMGDALQRKYQKVADQNALLAVENKKAQAPVNNLKDQARLLGNSTKLMQIAQGDLAGFQAQRSAEATARNQAVLAIGQGIGSAVGMLAGSLGGGSKSTPTKET